MNLNWLSVRKALIFTAIALALLKLGSLVIAGLEFVLPLRTALWGLLILTAIGAVYKLARLTFGAVRHKKNSSNYPFWLANQRKKGTDLNRYGFTMQPRDGRGRILTLSGGGYKAGLFHLGAIQELNERGLLNSIDAFASVSGGSITNAWLGANWNKLNFCPDSQRASNFDQAIFEPLFEFFTNTTIDAPAVLKGLLTFRSGAWYFSDYLGKMLLGDLKLSDFPEPGVQGKPNFFLTATDLRTNTSWRFSRLGDGDRPLKGCAYSYKLGTSRHDFLLRDAVAASAAFPPILSPMKLRLPELNSGGELNRTLTKQNVDGREAFEEYALLGDGGIYDNLGLERAKGYSHVLISNAGDPFEVLPEYERNWISQIRGTIRHMHRQVEQRRKIHFGDLKAIDRINLSIWEIDDVLDDEAREAYSGLDEFSAWRVATFPVRLKRNTPSQANLIIRHARSLVARQIELNEC